MRHDPVMLAEVLEYLQPKPHYVYADGTLGLAGHTLAVSEKLEGQGTVVGLDWDESMLAEAKSRLSEQKGIIYHLVHSDYRGMEAVMNSLGLKADGILLDLGLNSAQIDDATRGIAFKVEGPLDMRMDRSSGETAAALLNRLSPNEIEKILFEYGDERWARAIARKIVEIRKDKPLRTTQDLVDAVLATIPAKARDKRIHPATRTFQAVRIAVNRELEGLDDAVRGAARSLADNGVLVVLSYHSGEDRATKIAFKDLAQEGFVELTKKPLQPSTEEVARNPRSRSAKMRALKKVPA